MNSNEQILNKIRDKIKGITHPTPIKRILADDYEVLKEIYETDVWKIIINCLLNQLDVYPKAKCGGKRKYHNGKFLLVCNNYKNGDNDSCPICHQERTDVSVEKVKKTSMQKYGTEFPNQHESVKQKIAIANAEYDQDELLIKRRKTNLERYGVENIMQVPYFAEKQHEALRKLYQTEAYQQKRHQMFIDYRSKLALERNDNIEILHMASNNSEYSKFKCTICGNEIYSKLYARKDYIRCSRCYPYTRSMPEYIIHEFIVNVYDKSISTSDRSIITPYELDILLIDDNIAIEFNGNFWHNVNFLGETYHTDKFLKCLEKDIRLINIYDDDYTLHPDIVKNKLLSIIDPTDITEPFIIEPISTELFNQFYENHNFEKYRTESTSYHCVKVHDEVVGVFTKDESNNSVLISNITISQSESSVLHEIMNSTSAYDDVYLLYNADWGIPSSVQDFGFVFKEMISTDNYWYFKYPSTLVDEKTVLNDLKNMRKLEKDLTDVQILKKLRYNKVYGVGNALYVKHKEYKNVA